MYLLYLFSHLNYFCVHSSIYPLLALLLSSVLPIHLLQPCFLPSLHICLNFHSSFILSSFLCHFLPHCLFLILLVPLAFFSSFILLSRTIFKFALFFGWGAIGVSARYAMALVLDPSPLDHDFAHTVS